MKPWRRRQRPKRALNPMACYKRDFLNREPGLKESTSFFMSQIMKMHVFNFEFCACATRPR
jgi:hypothetical protein